jgi:hypothetical protein
MSPTYSAHHLEASSLIPIQTVYQLTEKELYEAQVQHNGWAGRIARIIGVLLSVLSAPFFLWAHQYTNALIGFAFGVTLAFGLFLSTKLIFRREPALRSETTVVVEEDGLGFVNSRGQNKLNWSAFVRFRENKKYLYSLYAIQDIQSDSETGIFTRGRYRRARNIEM